MTTKNMSFKQERIELSKNNFAFRELDILFNWIDTNITNNVPIEKGSSINMTIDELINLNKDIVMVFVNPKLAEKLLPLSFEPPFDDLIDEYLIPLFTYIIEC